MSFVSGIYSGRFGSTVRRLTLGLVGRGMIFERVCVKPGRCPTEIGSGVSLGPLLPSCKSCGTGDFESCLRKPPASKWSLSRTRRICDIAIAMTALSVCALPMLVIALCVALTSKGPMIFSQERLGLGGRRFRIYKFRTMTANRSTQGGANLTRDGDDRITSLGRWLRRLKLDELPQFYNILRGDMSLVGPRPKLPQYVAIAKMPYRPGITGAATLAFRHEEKILSTVSVERVDAFYAGRIKPVKARLDVCYMCQATPASDLRLIVATLLTCLKLGKIPALAHSAAVIPIDPLKLLTRVEESSRAR
jgi:lipopolysaccharide/colanic/teichoic acid biosynthesis glycosyltransferase